MKFSIKDFFSKCDKIHKKLWIWSHLLKKSLMKNFIFSAVLTSLIFGPNMFEFTIKQKRHLKHHSRPMLYF